jgi:ParB-like chromosome segregation protein Spo0J
VLRSSVAEQAVAPETLGETLAPLRLCTDQSLRHMRHSLSRHGQLTALAVYAPKDGGLEVIDGFKRLRAARELGLGALRVRVIADSALEAKLTLPALHDTHGLSELEEAWLVRSLYRDDHLPQPEIGRRLGRHKSWVSRRLLLAEALDDAVQADVRLGLLCAKSAQSVARLPRGNQRACADVVVRRGLTFSQTERLVAALLNGPDEDHRERLLAEALAGTFPKVASPATPPRARTEAEWIVADAAALVRLCGRLQARLLAQPLAALGEPAATLVTDALRGLLPALRTLARRIDPLTLPEPSHAPLDHA